MATTQGYGPDTGRMAPARFRDLGERVVLTGLDGRFAILTREEFQSVRAGTWSETDAVHAKLDRAGVLRSSFDVADVAGRLRRRRNFLQSGPNLHILVVTRRCNETCVYCHASRGDMDATGMDMSPETAEKCVDLAFASTAPHVTIEFQGGEPLVRWDVVKRVIEYGTSRGRGETGTFEFALVSNLSLMDEEKLAFLIDHRVQICTSVDGPADLHDHQRKLPGSSAFASTAHWIRTINARYAELGLDPNVYRVEALVTTTRQTLPRWKELVDTYVDLGCRALFLRPMDPYGFADKTRSVTGYSMDEYLEYYRNAVDYMIALNRQGVQVLERYAGLFLTKILGGEDPNFLDVRNPCGAGIGQVAYDHDGAIYTCDEGRMLRAMGDDTFRIGHVSDAKYRDLMGHPTVRAMSLASNLDQQPDCVNCAYQPYCGNCPVHAHRTQGSIFGRMRDSTYCATHKGIQDHLFRKIAEADPEVLRVFERWTTVRDRSHYIHVTHE